MPARALHLALAVLLALSAACAPEPDPEERAAAVEAFATVHRVFQHPRCRNCHIPGDAPLQFDSGRPHAMEVVRGEDGHGAPGLPCSACHGEENPPASYGPNAPPGAPHWALPPADQPMAWVGLSPAETCEMIRDEERNGGRELGELVAHVTADPLVLWGWDPGGERAPVSVAHQEFVLAFSTWAAAGGPCPGT